MYNFSLYCLQSYNFLLISLSYSSFSERINSECYILNFELTLDWSQIKQTFMLIAEEGDLLTKRLYIYSGFF